MLVTGNTIDTHLRINHSMASNINSQMVVDRKKAAMRTFDILLELGSMERIIWTIYIIPFLGMWMSAVEHEGPRSQLRGRK